MAIVVHGAIGKPRNTQRRAEVSVSVRERAFVSAGPAEPSIPLARGTDRTREDDGMNTGHWYLTEQPYGRVTGSCTGVPDMTAVNASRT